MYRLSLVDGQLYEKLGFMGSYDLKRCALLSVYVYSFVVILKILRLWCDGCYVLIVL